MVENDNFYTQLDKQENLSIPGKYLHAVLNALQSKGIAGINAANAIRGSGERARLRRLFKIIDQN